jgi:UDP-N-acetylmuramate dehydrogenase
LSEIIYNKCLQKLNTFKVEAKADAFLQLDSSDNLKQLFCTFSQYKNKMIVGGGSNLLFSGDYNGLIIYPQFFGIKITKETNKHIFLRVAASESWHKFVSSCLKKNYYGIENLALIPGTVGAAPVQNIGAYGVEVEKVIESVECFDLKKNEYIKLSHSDCQFSYRDSFLKKAGQGRYLVCHVNFVLNKLANPILSYAPLKKLSEGQIAVSSKDVFSWVCNLRKEKLPDPNVLANAGSFFKNPIVSTQQFLDLKVKFPGLVGYPDYDKSNYKLAAGWLIENAGLKGKRIGDVAVHEQQALVLVNFGESKGLKIWQLACYIMEKIKRLYQIDLEPEVRVLGINSKHNRQDR